MIRRPPRSTRKESSAASDVYKRQIKNLSAYLRKAAIDGKIEIHDYSGLKEINYNLRKIGVNINQIAKRINETNSIYQSDMEDIQRKVNEIWRTQKFILSKLH